MRHQAYTTLWHKMCRTTHLRIHSADTDSGGLQVRAKFSNSSLTIRSSEVVVES
jgi:hypothetical protein